MKRELSTRGEHINGMTLRFLKVEGLVDGGGPLAGEGELPVFEARDFKGRESRPKVDELESRYSPKVHTCIPVHAHAHTHSEDTV